MKMDELVEDLHKILFDFLNNDANKDLFWEDDVQYFKKYIEMMDYQLNKLDQLVLEGEDMFSNVSQSTIEKLTKIQFTVHRMLMRYKFTIRYMTTEYHLYYLKIANYMLTVDINLHLIGVLDLDEIVGSILTTLNRNNLLPLRNFYDSPYHICLDSLNQTYIGPWLHNPLNKVFKYYLENDVLKKEIYRNYMNFVNFLRLTIVYRKWIYCCPEFRDEILESAKKNLFKHYSFILNMDSTLNVYEKKVFKKNQLQLLVDSPIVLFDETLFPLSILTERFYKYLYTLEIHSYTPFVEVDDSIVEIVHLKDIKALDIETTGTEHFIVETVILDDDD